MTSPAPSTAPSTLSKIGAYLTATGTYMHVVVIGIAVLANMAGVLLRI